MVELSHIDGPRVNLAAARRVQGFVLTTMVGGSAAIIAVVEQFIGGTLPVGNICK